MAKKTAASDRRTGRKSDIGRSGYSVYGEGVYVFGNAVPQLQPEPEETPAAPKRQRKQVSRQAQVNRGRQLHINATYAAVICVGIVMIMMIDVMCLRLQADIVARNEHIQSMEKELAYLTEVNDANYNAAVSSVDSQTIRNKALNELGMVYESQGNVVEYESPTSDYVEQYHEIPEDGILSE